MSKAMANDNRADVCFNVLDELKKYCSLATNKRAIGEIEKLRCDVERLMRCIDMAMGCLDPDSANKDEALAWYRLYDAEMGHEPRKALITE